MSLLEQCQDARRELALASQRRAAAIGRSLVLLQTATSDHGAHLPGEAIDIAEAEIVASTEAFRAASKNFYDLEDQVVAQRIADVRGAVAEKQTSVLAAAI